MAPRPEAYGGDSPAIVSGDRTDVFSSEPVPIICVNRRATSVATAAAFRQSVSSVSFFQGRWWVFTASVRIEKRTATSPAFFQHIRLAD